MENTENNLPSVSFEITPTLSASKPTRKDQQKPNREQAAAIATAAIQILIDAGYPVGMNDAVTFSDGKRVSVVRIAIFGARIDKANRDKTGIVDAKGE